MPRKGKTTKSDAKTQSSKNMETKNECVQGSDGEAALGTSVQDLGDTLDSWQRRQTDICTNRKALSPHTVDPPAFKQPIAKGSTGQNDGADACRLRGMMRIGRAKLVQLRPCKGPRSRFGDWVLQSGRGLSVRLSEGCHVLTHQGQTIETSGLGSWWPKQSSRAAALSILIQNRQGMPA